MWDTVEEYGKAWVAIRKSQSLYRELTERERHRWEGVEDFLASWAMYKASKALQKPRNKKQLADIVMSRDASKVKS